MRYFIFSLLLTCCCSFANPELSLVFEKNKEGELILRIYGHQQTVHVQINDQTTVLYAEENNVNLSVMGIEQMILDTSSGENAKTTVPAVNPLLNPNPPFATPY